MSNTTLTVVQGPVTFGPNNETLKARNHLDYADAKNQPKAIVQLSSDRLSDRDVFDDAFKFIRTPTISMNWAQNRDWVGIRLDSPSEPQGKYVVLLADDFENISKLSHGMSVNVGGEKGTIVHVVDDNSGSMGAGGTALRFVGGGMIALGAVGVWVNPIGGMGALGIGFGLHYLGTDAYTQPLSLGFLPYAP